MLEFIPDSFHRAVSILIIMFNLGTSEEGKIIHANLSPSHHSEESLMIGTGIVAGHTPSKKKEKNNKFPPLPYWECKVIGNVLARTT
jgi:hypothetical protein